MGFGLSGRSDSTFMVGADATITWVDSTTGSPNAVDYYITGRSQVCSCNRYHSYLKQQDSLSVCHIFIMFPGADPVVMAGRGPNIFRSKL